MKWLYLTQTYVALHHGREYTFVPMNNQEICAAQQKILCCTQNDRAVMPWRPQMEHFETM